MILNLEGIEKVKEINQDQEIDQDQKTETDDKSIKIKILKFYIDLDQIKMKIKPTEIFVINNDIKLNNISIK